MFFQENQILSLLRCQNCKQTYDENQPPRILTCCSKTVCYLCIKSMVLLKKEAESVMLKCILCQEDCFITEEHLPVNDLAVAFLSTRAREVYRGDEAQILKQNLNRLDSLATQLKHEIEFDEELIKEECNQLRKKIELAKDKRIGDINQSFSILFNKIDIYEEKCIRNSKETNQLKQQAMKLIEQVNISIQKHKNYLNQLRIDEKEIRDSNEKLDDFKARIESERENLKSFRMNNTLIKFEATETLDDENLIGNLNYEIIKFKKIIACIHNSIKLIDLNNGTCLKTFEGHSEWVHCAKPLNAYRIVSCSSDNTLKIWDICTTLCIKTLQGHTDVVWCFEILSENRIASGSFDKTIRIWNSDSGVCIKILKGHSSRIMDIKKVRNQRLISGSNDGKIHLWDLNSGEILRTLNRYKVSVIESLSNESIISGSDDSTIKILNIQNGECNVTLNGHKNRVNCIRVFSDHERIISCSSDKTIKVWCLRTNCCIKTLYDHQDDIKSIQILSNENQIASSSWDETIKIWDLVTGNCLKTLRYGNPVTSIQMF